MGRLLKFLIIIGIDLFMHNKYADGSLSALNIQENCESKTMRNTKECLRKKYGDQRYIFSRSEYNEDVSP
jgi:hypothetical protein